MREIVHDLAASVPDFARTLAQTLAQALGEPGALDRVGALAIGVVVTACLLLAPSS